MRAGRGSQKEKSIFFMAPLNSREKPKCFIIFKIFFKLRFFFILWFCALDVFIDVAESYGWIPG